MHGGPVAQDSSTREILVTQHLPAAADGRGAEATARSVWMPTRARRSPWASPSQPSIKAPPAMPFRAYGSSTIYRVAGGTWRPSSTRGLFWTPARHRSAGLSAGAPSGYKPAHIGSHGSATPGRPAPHRGAANHSVHTPPEHPSCARIHASAPPPDVTQQMLPSTCYQAAAQK